MPRVARAAEPSPRSRRRGLQSGRPSAPNTRASISAGRAPTRPARAVFKVATGRRSFRGARTLPYADVLPQSGCVAKSSSPRICPPARTSSAA